jgi:hypothetical protein
VADEDSMLHTNKVPSVNRRPIGGMPDLFKCSFDAGHANTTELSGLQGSAEGLSRRRQSDGNQQWSWG